MGDFETRRRAKLYRRRSIILATTGIVLVVVSFMTWPALLVPAFIMFVVAASMERKQALWRIGARGEEEVKRILEGLDQSFYVVHDVVLPGQKGNIDHVVVGPTGTYVLETKNYTGIVRCSGDEWSRQKIGRRGTVYGAKIGTPSKQAKRNASELREWLTSQGIDVGFVSGIVVFTGDVTLELTEPAIQVVHAKDLLGAFGDKPHHKMTPETIITTATRLTSLDRK